MCVCVCVCETERDREEYIKLCEYMSTRVYCVHACMHAAWVCNACMTAHS